MSKTVKWLLFFVCGLSGFAAVGYLLHATHWAVVSWMVFRIVPFGAIFIGGVGALGFFGAARLCNLRASPVVVASMIIAASGFLFYVEYLDYRMLVEEQFRSRVTFSRYLDLKIRTSHYVTHRRSGTEDSGPLGAGGYVVMSLQVAGLAIGSAVAAGVLAGYRYCRECSRYYQDTASNTRYFQTAHELAMSVATVKPLLQSGATTAGLAAHAGSGAIQTSAPNAGFRSSTKLSRCPGCGKRHLSYTMEAKGPKSDWVTLGQHSVEQDLPPVAAEAAVSGCHEQSGNEVVYELLRDGQFYGPYTTEDLRHFVATKHVLLSDRLRRCDTGTWCNVAAVLHS